MQSFRNNSAEQIAKRIKELAKKAWDVSEIDDILLKFMIDANASEIKLVYDQLDESEDRILNRFATLLLPDIYTGVQPAHALVHATPVNTSLYHLQRNTSFYAERKDVKYYFTPATDTYVFNGFIGAVAINSQTYYPEKTIFNVEIDRVIENDNIYSISLGFFFHESVTSIENFSIYFEIGNVSRFEQMLFIESLAKCNFYLNGKNKTADIKMGLPHESMPALQRSLIPVKKAEKAILDTYAGNFLTIRGPIDWWHEGSLLPDISNLDQDKCESINKREKTKMVLVDMLFESPLKLTKASGNFRIGMNVFPVINRQYHEGTHSFSEFSPKLIPLSKVEKDSFLIGIEEVFGFPASNKSQKEKKHVFHELPIFSIKLGQEGAGSYALRPGGIDRNETYSLIDRFSYVFSKYRQELKVQELIKILSFEEFEALVKHNNKDYFHTTPTPYILINPVRVEKDNFTIFLQYWTAQGGNANKDFSRDTVLWGEAESKKNPFSDSSIYFLTRSFGGNSPKMGIELLTYLKDNLLRRNNIITELDVKSFVYNFLDNFEEIQIDNIDIEICKDFEIHPDPDYGLTRILKVALTFSDNLKTEQKKGICTLLEKELNNESSSWIPIRVRFK